MPAQPPKENQSASKPAQAPKKEKPKIIRVRAKRLGFGPLSPNSPNHSRIKPNTVFNFALAPGAKLPNWVEEVDDDNNPLNGLAGEQSDASSESGGSSSDDVL